MAQPTTYTRRYNFTQFSTLSPSAQQPGTYLDAEFNALKTTLDQTLSNLKLIQRDDGALQNGSVHVETLGSDVTVGVKLPIAWVSGATYAVNDSVVVNSVTIYRCLIAHTAGTFSTDLGAGKWIAVLDATSTFAAVGTFTSGAFTGNGIQTVFNLGSNIGAAERVIWVEAGVVKAPGTDYTISGTNVTRLAAPGNGVAIAWRLLGSASSSATGVISGPIDNVTIGGVTPGAATFTQVNSGPLAGFRNRLINGAMLIDQRNETTSVTPTTINTRTYIADRWAAYVSVASKFSIQTINGGTPPQGFRNYLRVTSLSAYTPGTSEVFLVQQPIEAANIDDLGWGANGGSPVTLSFYVRSSLTGIFGGAISNGDNTRSYPFSVSIPTPNAWTKVQVQVPGDTTGTWLVSTATNAGMFVTFSMGAGATVTSAAGSWVAGNFVKPTGGVDVVGTNGATFDITGVQLERGNTATPFEFRHFSAELALCQRYYEKTYDQGTKPGTSGSGIIGSWIYNVGGTATPAQGGTTGFWKVSKRIPPSAVTFYSPVTGAVGKARDYGSNVDVNAGAFTSNTNNFSWSATMNTGATVHLGVHATGEAEI